MTKHLVIRNCYCTNILSPSIACTPESNTYAFQKTNEESVDGEYKKLLKWKQRAGDESASQNDEITELVTPPTLMSENRSQISL